MSRYRVGSCRVGAVILHYHTTTVHGVKVQHRGETGGAFGNRSVGRGALNPIVVSSGPCSQPAPAGIFHMRKSSGTISFGLCPIYYLPGWHEQHRQSPYVRRRVHQNKVSSPLFKVCSLSFAFPLLARGLCINSMTMPKMCVRFSPPLTPFMPDLIHQGKNNPKPTKTGAINA